jgi:hypothetical protein
VEQTGSGATFVPSRQIWKVRLLERHCLVRMDAHHHVWDLAGYGEVIGAAGALTAALSPSERAALFGGTAARWYGIPAC